MRPWTTRTAQAAVVAAGFAAVGTGAAAAAEEAAIPRPDLSSVPDHITILAPANACQAQEGPGYGPVKMPCADSHLHANAPNLVKKVGADVTTTAHGMAGELQDGRPLLTPGKPNRVLGHVFAQTTRVKHMTKARPTVGGSVNPAHLGIVTERIPDATLLETEVRPYEAGHQGTSALDTAVELNAVQGYEAGPVANPVGVVTPTLANDPLKNPTLPRMEKLVPALGKLPATPQLSDGADRTVTGIAKEAVKGVPQEPVRRIVGQLPAAEDVTGLLR